MLEREKKFRPNDFNLNTVVFFFLRNDKTTFAPKINIIASCLRESSHQDCYVIILIWATVRVQVTCDKSSLNSYLGLKKK